MRPQRRLGVALALASFALLTDLFPLSSLFLVLHVAWAATTWLATAVVQSLLGFWSAHLLFAARHHDRTRAQTLCSWVGIAALVMAGLGFLAAAAAALVASFLASLGPWCGVCGT